MEDNRNLSNWAPTTAKKIRKSILSKCLRAKNIGDRKMAIRTAIKNLSRNEILIIAGKGHENTQIYKNKTKIFDDKKIVKNLIKEMQR